MLKKIVIGFGVLLLAFVAFFGYGLLFPVSPPSTATIQSNGLEVSVTYSQPAKKGRLIFGEESSGALQPYGKYWRLGANAATEITFSEDVSFAGENINAGTYRMYAVPGPESFEISLNTETGVYFGVAEPNYELDILKLRIPVQSHDPAVENLTISFEDTNGIVIMSIAWDMTLLQIPIQQQ